MGRVTAISERQAKLTNPTLLRANHELDEFKCGQPSLDAWLKDNARGAMEGDTAKTYVVSRGPRRVVAYYSLAAGAMQHEGLPGKLRRNTPNPIPVLLLARLAVDETEAGAGIGSGLLRDAMKKSVRAASIIAARAMVIHALNDEAMAFYQKLGFMPIAADSKTLFLTMKDIRAAL